MSIEKPRIVARRFYPQEPDLSHGFGRIFLSFACEIKTNETNRTVAVLRAAKAGRITLEPDGTIEWCDSAAWNPTEA